MRLNVRIKLRKNQIMENSDEYEKEVSSNEKNADHLSRRSFVTKASLTLIGASTLAYSVPSKAATSTATNVTEEELAPFRKIAQEKGVKITFMKEKATRTRALSQMHLDMDMVRASLDNAIERATNQNLSKILPRLQRLRASGTAAQQVDFVLGSGRQYMFPEDVEKIAARAEKNKFHTFGVVCNTFCWLSCICTGDNNQECQQQCRDVICPDPEPAPEPQSSSSP